jgi:hypothetical protein
MTDFGAPAYTMATTTPYPTTTPGLPSGGGGGAQAGQDGGGGDGGAVDLALVMQGTAVVVTTAKVVAVLARRGMKVAWRKALGWLREAREKRLLEVSKNPVLDEEAGQPRLPKLRWQLRLTLSVLEVAADKPFPSVDEDAAAGVGSVAVCANCATITPADATFRVDRQELRGTDGKLLFGPVKGRYAPRHMGDGTGNCGASFMSPVGHSTRADYGNDANPVNGFRF